MRSLRSIGEFRDRFQEGVNHLVQDVHLHQDRVVIVKAPSQFALDQLSYHTLP